MIYKQRINPITGQFNLVSKATVITFKAHVADQAHLPLIGNTFGDGRITDDNNHLYVWSLDATSGLLTDWIDQGDILDVTWAAIEGKPSSSPADIDDAVSKRHSFEEDTDLQCFIIDEA